MTKLSNQYVPLSRRAPQSGDMVQVTWIETGVSRTMWRGDFFETFGADEGKEVLAGMLPHIVAVEISGALPAIHRQQAQRGSF